jgi:hypothetical protein
VNVDHRAEAEALLKQAAKEFITPDGDPTTALAAAQVHATLARNEEQTGATADLREALLSLRRRYDDTRTLVSTHIAQGLASREADRWKAAIDLTKALDEAHCNMDDLVDGWLGDNGWDPRSAYKAPAGSGGWIGYANDRAGAAPERDPWAATPDVTSQIPEPVRRVLVEYLAAALLSKGDAQGVGQTITFALKHAGADLTGDIEKQISDITLGRDPSDPPF